MIFATCGSSKFPFERMMEALKALPAEELHVQHGHAEAPRCARAYPFLTFREMIEQIELADVVVSHAGVGSVLCAIRAGHTPIIFPRLSRYSEHVDDHQAELAEALAERGTAVVARTPGELAAAVASVPPRRVDMTVGSRTLVDAVRAQILGAQLAPAADAGVVGLR
jgi:UDP-N-acetylglucosamine--N-acetylmuramyl-(pentapeptide) pyrophosphoryl-undecaprenol N-acetylglucosamine transferase